MNHSSEMTKTEALRSCVLFSKLTDEEIQRILTQCESRPFSAGTIIFDDGSADTSGMYVIVRGSVKIYKIIQDASERRQAIAILKAGNYFGDMALLDEETRSAGAMALDDCELLFLSKEAFNTLINQNLETAHHVLTQISKVMSKRLRDTNNLFREVVSWGYRARKEVRDLKTNFLSTISHELRTPIHSIQGFSTLMKDAKDTDLETQQKFVEIIMVESKRLGDLINNLISLAEIEFGSIVLERQPASLAEVFQTAFENQKAEADEKNIACYFDIPEQLPTVQIDVQRMVLACEHLINNAIKFTPTGKSVQFKIEDSEKALLMHFTDTGKGIPAKYLERIFEKFYQVDQSTTREFEGAGIGLTLARQIVQLHGGTIHVKSKEGDGSTFTIHLPKEHVLYK